MVRVNVCPYVYWNPSIGLVSMHAMPAGREVGRVRPDRRGTPHTGTQRSAKTRHNGAKWPVSATVVKIPPLTVVSEAETMVSKSLDAGSNEGQMGNVGWTDGT